MVSSWLSISSSYRTPTAQWIVGLGMEPLEDRNLLSMGHLPVLVVYDPIIETSGVVIVTKGEEPTRTFIIPPDDRVDPLVGCPGIDDVFCLPDDPARQHDA